MDELTVINKYGIKLMPKVEKVRPMNLDALNGSNEAILEIAKRVMEKHQDVLDALAKR